MTSAATEARPLTDAERDKLTELLAREKGTPAARLGEPYMALVSLSVPRRGDKDRNTDLVMPGETVYLTEGEARQFNRHGVRDGKQVDVLRKLSGPDGSREPLPQVGANGASLLPRHVSGRLFRPATPPPGSDAPRPDPEGSSSISVLDDGRAPEGEPARPGPEEMADHLRETVVPDAVDLPPRNARPRARS